MPMCGEGYIGFQEWLIKKEKKHSAKKKRH
jgi:hypothetical protein